MKKLILKEKVNLKKYCNNNLIKIIKLSTVRILAKSHVRMSLKN